MTRPTESLLGVGGAAQVTQSCTVRIVGISSEPLPRRLPLRSNSQLDDRQMLPASQVCKMQAKPNAHLAANGRLRRSTR